MRRVDLLQAHGSPSHHLYSYHGCRCVACRGARAVKSKAYHAAYNAEHREEGAAHKAAYYVAHRDEMRARSAAHYAANREQRTAHGRAYYAANREALAASAAAYYVAHREEKHAYYVAHSEEASARKRDRTFDLLPGEWDARFANQGNRCGCCGNDDPGHRFGWCTDHDHKTGVVRGILCSKCNTGLGQFQDDPEVLMAAIEYLAAATL